MTRYDFFRKRIAPIAFLIVVGLIPVAIYYRKARGYYTRRPLELPDELDEKAPPGIDDRDPAR